MKLDVENKLLQKNTTPTSMRILVYDFLEKKQMAMSLSEIQQCFFKADRVTIYRTIKTFEEKGIVHSIQENNVTKYSLCQADCTGEQHQDGHLHFYCKVCLRTTCKEGYTMPQFGQTDFRVDAIQLYAQGVCEGCLSDTA